MSKEKIMIQFESLHQLWQFAQKIGSNNIEIKTRDCLLICDCSDEELQWLGKFNGKKIEQLARN